MPVGARGVLPSLVERLCDSGREEEVRKVFAPFLARFVGAPRTLENAVERMRICHAIRERVLGLGAAHFFAAVFCEKRIDKPKPIQADFVGVTVPNRYVFGYGMDVAGLWRNLPAIHAVHGK